MATVPIVKDVLLVGFGAIGAICASTKSDPVLNVRMPLDSLVLERSGFARVTAVARSNYDAVHGENASDRQTCMYAHARTSKRVGFISKVRNTETSLDGGPIDVCEHIYQLLREILLVLIYSQWLARSLKPLIDHTHMYL
jgi:hypothetical protein